jgi:hypothetical protein
MVPVTGISLVLKRIMEMGVGSVISLAMVPVMGVEMEWGIEMVMAIVNISKLIIEERS